MTEQPIATPGRMIKLRYPGRCRTCGAELARGERAMHYPNLKAVECLNCISNSSVPEAVVQAATPQDAERAEPIEVADPAVEGDGAAAVEGLAQATKRFDRGVAGASARREYERRLARDEILRRERFGRWDRFMHAIFGERTGTQAWGIGAIGEEKLGRRLNELCDASGGSMEVLHDRRKPRTRAANIDHILITPSAVLVIDAKHYSGRPDLRVSGFPWNRKTEFVVSGRRKENLIDGVLGQVEVVRAIIGAVPTVPILCFIGADWPLFINQLQHRGVLIVSRRRLFKIVRRYSDGALDVAGLAEQLNAKLLPN